MLTGETVLQAFQVLEMSGLRRPENLTATDPEQGMLMLQRTADVYAAVLADLSPEDLRLAVLGWLRRASPFWPTPGQLLAETPTRRLEVIDDADPAWATARAWCLKHGRRVDGNGYRTPEAGELDASNLLRDEAMREALRTIGGVRAFMQSNEKDEPWVAKRFSEAYRTHRARAKETRELAAITGPAGRQIGGGFQRLLGGR